MLPPFDHDGVLPPGDYELTFDELRESILVMGPDPAPSSWDSEWRARLVDSLEVMVGQLWAAGVTEVFIDGSFVEDEAMAGRGES